MKKSQIILLCALMALAACTKSKEVHPEIGDGNDEIVTVGTKDVHVEYTRIDHADLQKVVFHYSLAETQQFAAAVMTKQEAFFELTLHDLVSDTLYSYYYELFPKSGSAFQSSQKTFHTQAFDMPEPPTPPDTIPEGAINGLFSVSPTQKVYISQGNLQYQASTNTWRFAEQQWDYVGSEVVMDGSPGGTVTGSSNHLVSESYEGWIDMFAFGTSGYNHGAVCYQPWATSCFIGSDYYPYGSPSYNLYDQTGRADWGVNSISNGGNVPNRWRTLKQEEMFYLLYSRNIEVSFVRAMVNGIKGMLLLPDDWDVSTYQFNSQNEGDVPYNVNVISLSVWCDVLEPSGAAFFPAAGFRQGSNVFVVNSWGQYTLSSVFDEMYVYRFGFNEGINSSGVDYGSFRYNANSVRLVQDAIP